MTPFNPQPKKITWESEKYREFVRSLPCVVFGCNRQPVCHHCRFSHNSGTGQKPSDTWGLPICDYHHDQLHKRGIKTFLSEHGIDLYEELFLVAKSYIEASLK